MAIAVVALATFAVAGGARVDADGPGSAPSQDDIGLDLSAPDPGSPIELLAVAGNDIDEQSRFVRLLSVVAGTIVLAAAWRARCRPMRWVIVGTSGVAPYSTRGPPGA